MLDSRRRPGDGRGSLIAGAGLVALTLAAYSDSLGGEFIFDDQSSILKNPTLARMWPPWAPLISPSVGGTRGRPLVNLTFALNNWAGGLHVWGYHALNLAIHVMAGLVLFGIARRTLTRPILAERFHSAARPLAFGVAALWLVHPLATESVTYLSQRTESLMGLCYLSTLYCVIRGACPERAKGGWYAAAVLTGFLGMASKEAMITAPIVVFLYDRTFLAGSFAAAWKARRPLYIGLAGGWVLLGYLMVGVGERGAGLGLGVSSWSYALCESQAIVHYLGLSFWPHSLIFDYGTALGPGWPAAAPSVALVLALGAGTLLLLRYRPPLGFVMFWFLAILAPTSSIVPVALQPVAENRMYLPLIAVIALVATGTYLLLSRWSAVVLAGCALCLAWTTYARNEDYRTAVSIWRDTASKRPMNARAHGSLGNSLLSAGKTAEGTEELSEALRISPGDPDLNLDMGVAIGKTGNIADAIPRIQKALSANPGLAEGYFDLGWLYTQSGRTTEALEEYAHALALRPDYHDAHCNLADLLMKDGRFSEAIPHYESALREGTPEPDLYYNLAFARIKTGSLADAISDYRQALLLKPDFVEARRNLELLEGMGRGQPGAGAGR